MRKHCRARVRTRGQRVLNAVTRLVPYFGYAQITQNWREWSFRSVSLKKAQELEKSGEAEAITRMVDGFVRVVGYRATKPIRVDRPSPCTLTMATMMAVGNNETGNKEAMARLTRGERNQIEKFQVWALIGDDKAVCVRPKLNEMERKIAERLLGRGVQRQAQLGSQLLSGMLSAA